MSSHQALFAVLALWAMAGASQGSPVLDAFPGAEGAGRAALGGRGGNVLKVTTLADEGPGSLRAAIEAKGPRTVVFEVAGTIRLKSPLRVAEGRITVAGQSALGEGVTLADQALVVAADDVVIRYIRVRLGDLSGVQEDAIWVRGGRRIILDHVSASWSVDETLSVADRDPPRDVTVQWSLIAESLNRSGHDKGRHGYGSLVRGGRGSRYTFHHNLWASHQARMPRPGNYAGRAEDPEGAYFDFRNNVFYNWAGDASGYNADKGALAAYNFVGNAYITGPDSKGELAFREENSAARSWFAGNAMNGKVPADPWSLVAGLQNRLPGELPMPAVRTEGWDAAYRAVLAKAGSSLARDAVDRRIIEGVAARTHRIIDSQADVGGWPALRSGAARPDADADGMPDDWERANGLDARNAADGARAGRNGYTNLERYLNGLV